MTWQQVTTPNTAQTSEPYWCAYFVFQAFGGQNGWGFNTAAEAWAGQANKHHGEHPPAGVYVPVWFDWYGTLNGVYQNWGHVAISMPDGRVLSSPTEADRAKGQSIFNNIDHCAQAMGASYVGWSESMDGTTVVQRAALAGNQRQAGGSQVNRRAEPTTQSALLEPPLEPNDIGNFDAWVYGETVEGNNVWFRGISGNWFWSGGFTDTGTHDLAHLNTPAPSPTAPQPEPQPQPEPANPDQALLENTSALKALTETLKNIFKAV